MKKLFSLLLAVLMLLSLAACGNGSGDTDDGKKTDKVEQNGKNETDSDPNVVIDNDDCYIRIKDTDPDGDWGYTIIVELENRSDKALTFYLESAAVNGVQCDPTYSAELQAGDKITDEISIWEEYFCGVDIGEYTDIELTLSVYDDIMFDSALYTETVHYYPLGEEAATTFVREAQDTDIVIADNEHAKVIVIGCGEDDSVGYTVTLMCINKMKNRDIDFTIDEGLTINGVELDPYFGCTVGPGKCSFSQMDFFESELEDNNIDTVSRIVFTLTGYYYADDDPEMELRFTTKEIVLEP